MNNAAFIILGISLLLQSLLLLRKQSSSRLVGWLLLPAPLLMTAETIRRSVLIRHPDLGGTYGVLILFSTLLLYAAAIRSIRNCNTPWIEFGSSLLVLFLLAFASSPLVSDALRPPIPILKSSWLIIHVSLAFIGESFFAFAFITSIAQLMTIDGQKKERFDRLTRKAICIGYPVFLTGAILFGAIWAKHAWGRYWGWDPKELWALITLLVYTLYIAVRVIWKKSGATTAWIAIAGFLTAMFTFLGVNFLLSSLHSYR